MTLPSWTTIPPPIRKDLHSPQHCTLVIPTVRRPSATLCSTSPPTTPATPADHLLTRQYPAMVLYYHRHSTDSRPKTRTHGTVTSSVMLNISDWTLTMHFNSSPYCSEAVPPPPSRLWTPRHSRTPPRCPNGSMNVINSHLDANSNLDRSSSCGNKVPPKPSMNTLSPSRISPARSRKNRPMKSSGTQ